TDAKRNSEKITSRSAENRIQRLCSDVTGPGSRCGPGGARIPVGYRPDAPARVRSSAGRAGAGAPLAGASGRSADGPDQPGIDATASWYQSPSGRSADGPDRPGIEATASD